MPLFDSAAFVRTELVAQAPECSRFSFEGYDGRECRNTLHARSELVTSGARSLHVGLEAGGTSLSDAYVIHVIAPTQDPFPFRDGRLALNGGVAWRKGAFQGAVDLVAEGSALGPGTAARLEQAAIAVDNDRSLAVGVRSAAAARIPLVGATTFEGRATLGLGNEVSFHTAPDLTAQQRDDVKLRARDLDGTADLRVGIGVPIGANVLAFTLGPKVTFATYGRNAREGLARIGIPSQVTAFQTSWDLVGGVTLDVPFQRQP